MSSPCSSSTCSLVSDCDELVAAHPDVPVDLPHREHESVLAERAVPRDRVLVVRVDERAVDVEYCCGGHARSYDAPAPDGPYCSPPSMRAIFTVYLVFVLLGLAYFIVIGLSHH